MREEPPNYRLNTDEIVAENEVPLCVCLSMWTVTLSLPSFFSSRFLLFGNRKGENLLVYKHRKIIAFSRMEVLDGQITRALKANGIKSYRYVLQKG